MSEDDTKVRTAMNRLLRQLTAFRNNTRAKLVIIIKFREELGPEWTTRVIASLDDIIHEAQYLRQGLEAALKNKAR